ncbi:MAG: PrgI family protein, partial [Patescibacteria group bacterium]|nr:PrgI family protein [Patescibacteria group bacterium]
MQQFTVPQFIDVEDKIIGPITARQFIIMFFGFMLMIVCYKFFDFSLFLGSSIAIFAISGVFAFFKVNGMPFHFFVLNFIQTSKKPKKRVWINEGENIIEDAKKIIKEYAPITKKHISASRLSELALIVDTSGAYRGEVNAQANKEIKENIKTVK